MRISIISNNVRHMELQRANADLMRRYTRMVHGRKGGGGGEARIATTVFYGLLLGSQE